MGETSLFSIVQVTIPVSFLFLFPSTCLVTNPSFVSRYANDERVMGRCLNHEMALDRITAKARSTEDKFVELKA